MSKTHTYTVMHDKGEFIDGRIVQAHEEFKAIPTPEIEAKVEKGLLIDGGLTPSEKKIAQGKATIEDFKRKKKSTSKRRVTKSRAR
jgi:hypothetical protein